MKTGTTALLHRILDDRARRSPSAVALRQQADSWTYAELAQASLAYAGWLRSLGVGRGDRVVLAMPHAAETVALVYAVSRLGAVYVVIGDQMKPYVLKHIAADCEPAVVVGHDAGHLLDQFGPALHACPRWRTRPVPDDLPDSPVLVTDPVSLIYTSGSTAMPKAVISAHREVLFVTGAIQARLGYRGDDVVFCCLPLSFDYGLYQAFLACVAGAALVVGAAADAGPPLVSELLRHRVTILPAVPTVMAVLDLLLGRSGGRMPELRMITNTGASLAPALTGRLAEMLPGTAIVPMFGLTECKRVTITPLDQLGTRPGSSGTALPGTEILVVDDDGNRLPPGEVGELVVRGPHVMPGYWRASAATARRFKHDEFGGRELHTGDLCRIDADGHLYFVGRRDDLYKQHGVRMSAAEVEMAALDMPGVESAALLPPTAEHGALLLVTGTLDAAAVLAGLAERLERVRLPAECRVLPALPLHGNGKIDKPALVATVRAGQP